jgi:ABC-2 type transport system ATP-binding protein
MSDLAIDLSGVTKVYKGSVHALQGVSIGVRRGEIFGLLGPNGAGKSTLIKIMMTVVRPTMAHGTLLDKPVGHKPTLARIGYLPEHHRFPRYLTGRQTLEFVGALSGVDKPTRKKRSAELIETVGMTDWADQKVGSYSKGMMQRIGLAQALVNDPDLVLLDEPTDGVDPAGRKDIRDVLKQIGARGKTVFLNSHLLSELELVADRVAILVGGQVAKQGTVADLTSDKAGYEIDVTPLPIEGLSSTLAAITSPDGKKLKTGVNVIYAGSTVKIDTTNPADAQPVLDEFRKAGLTVTRMQAVRPSLEDLYMEAVTDPTTGKTARPGAARTPPPVPVRRP